MIVPAEPTSEECSSNASFRVGNQPAFACWYPQIGGYGSRCVVVLWPANGNSCFDAFIWHDGEFPFAAESNARPALLHHCDADQFIMFGELVKKMSPS